MVNIESPIQNAFSEADERLMVAVVDLVAASWERIGEAERRAASEQRFRTLFETCSDAILVLDLKGKIISANPAAAGMHGYTCDELLALNVRDLDDPESALAVPNRLSRLLAGESLRFEVNHVRKDGSRFPVDVAANTMTLDGETMILAFDRDISAQKHAEKALLSSEQRYRLMLETITLGVIVHDGDTIYYANPAAARILGYDSPDALLGESPFELMPPKVHDLARRSMERVSASSEPLRPVELQTYRRDGTVIDVEVHSITCRYNERDCVQAHFQDITERKKVSERIRRSEERFSTLFYRCPFCIMAAAYPGGIILEANQAFLDLFEADRQAVLGRTPLELNPWEDLADRQVMLDSIRREGRLRQGEFWFRTMRENRRLLLMSVEMITVNGEQATLAMSVDITARRIAEDSLKATYTLLQAVTDTAEDAIFVKNREGKYLLFNPAAARFVGKPIRRFSVICLPSRGSNRIGGLKKDEMMYESEQARRLNGCRRVNSLPPCSPVMGGVNSPDHRQSLAGNEAVFLRTKSREMRVLSPARTCFDRYNATGNDA